MTRRLIKWGLLLAFVALLCGPDLITAWRSVRFRSRARRALDGPVAHLEVQASSDDVAYLIEDQERIREFTEWLLATTEVHPLRSPLPRLDCEIRMEFSDGHVEKLRCSEFREPLEGGGFREHVTVDVTWLGHRRVGPVADLARILDEPEDGRSP